MAVLKPKKTKIEKTVVGAYKKIEDTVVGTYQKIEDTVVGTYQKIEGKFVEKFLEVDEGAETAQKMIDEECNKKQKEENK